MRNFVETEEFVELVDDWLANNDQKTAAKLFTKKAAIPPMFKNVSKTLYRGMTVDASFLEKSKQSSGVIFSTFSSWSKDKSLAIKFASDPQFSITKKDGIKILLEKKITLSDIVMDIHAYALFMGKSKLETLGMDDLSIDSAFKESEVLIKKNLKVTIKDVTFL